ncbi:DUF2326 domain-containing protein [Providencia heimbachae]|uniref:DUF2326 domain-containing protein n=1 Tax=Providencia heimbachae TaxID=333962 RepID=UPI0008396E6A|nr:DUF2326 domain-containing protein [Providencia heimbachae]NIH22109.1 hypothetical protein [Providencia heimbachae]
MLKSIECEKLISTSLNFKQGLNTLVGADDAYNSIGKSSVLMLIDFAFAGDDFPKKCDDVIKNIGHLDIKITFKFDKVYSFLRSTNTPDHILNIENNEILGIEDFRFFLQTKYHLNKIELSFRETVSAFFRIYQRDNYNEKEPLNIVSKEPWKQIEKRILKFFEEYEKIEPFEKNRKLKEKLKSDINGTFNSGSVKKITKTQLEKNKIIIDTLDLEINILKDALSLNITNMKEILNDKNNNLTTEKEKLLDSLQKTKMSLYRIEKVTLKKGKETKALESIMELIPSANIDKLNKIDQFHNGIATILNKQLDIEKNKLLMDEEIVNKKISEINLELKKCIPTCNENIVLLDNLINIDRQTKDLSNQNKYFELNEETKKEIDSINNKIKDLLQTSIIKIQNIINSTLTIFIKNIYPISPIEPTLIINSKGYKFDCGDDRGTGKGFANLISLDLVFLEKTLLPCIIHDSLLFKNLDISAVENLINTYSSFDKQIFISIDEVKKYNKAMQTIVNNSMFLKLDKDHTAFKINWKIKT